MSDEAVNIKGLDGLLKALKNIPNVKVGILGGKNSRSDTSTNASIGAKHEYGDENMPERSFLRVPISDNLQTYLDKNGAMDPDVLKRLIKEGTFAEYIKKIGVTAEEIVTDAFDTGGFGKWAEWSNPNYQNNTGQILKDTQQLSRSITSEVDE